MITRGCFFLTLMVNCVLSLPVSSHLEDEDVKVMKCIVEVIADALSTPHPIPVSQDCLDSLRADKRLISILRRQNFLKELQEIAVQGASERVLQQTEGKADHVTGGLTNKEDIPDRSMLAFLDRPADSVAEKREREDDEGAGSEGESREASEDGGDADRKGAGAEPDGHVSNSLNEEVEEEGEEKRASVEGDAEKEGDGNGTDDTQVKDVGETELAKDAPEVKPQGKQQSKEKKEVEPEPGEAQKAVEEKRDFGESQRRKEEQEKKEEEERELKRWGERDRPSERVGAASSRKMAEGELGGGAVDTDHPRGPRLPQEAPHHSKEEVQKEAHRSPEALELQMMARREAEEGSANRKTEDHEVESLAAIESELESMAQKLHELRRG
ncbi:hypothetical protein AGOR_G00088540 [Albula goreensis]|uniref:Chromogranin-A n=1 Tax=Albula goreensis TaxID=1534307 RepID=A0A8T3DRG5_9TELE|nr:hypothetical protein AGOR_G00088540 [Albula goreensis]